MLGIDVRLGCVGICLVEMYLVGICLQQQNEIFIDQGHKASIVFNPSLHYHMTLHMKKKKERKKEGRQKKIGMDGIKKEWKKDGMDGIKKERIKENIKKEQKE